jgi:hypothetical protein
MPQVLHCRAQDMRAKGGESLLVDGVAAAEALRAADEDAFGKYAPCGAVLCAAHPSVITAL